MNEETNGNHIYEPPQERARSYTLTALQQEHIREVQAQMSELAGDILKLKGAIFDKQQEMSFMRRHLGVHVAEIAKQAGMPPNADLLPDGRTIVVREG